MSGLIFRVFFRREGLFNGRVSFHEFVYDLSGYGDSVLVLHVIVVYADEHFDAFDFGIEDGLVNTLALPDGTDVGEGFDGEAQDLNIFIRGNVERKGPTVPRRFIRVLSDGEPRPFKEGSGRKELAEAIASPQNPLTARVMVNRVWGMLMGRPLVGTPSNFGHSGELPTHPELLDDLAVRFMENDWSIKWLVREVVLSATYGQSSLSSERGAQDASNVLMWRVNRRRLTVEQWRDMALFTSGRLDRNGGKSMELDDPFNFRRTVYARISRLKLNDLLMQFDYPDANVHAEKRSVTTTPAQKLFMLNSPFVIGAAKSLVARLGAEGIEEDNAKIERVYGVVLGRKPRIEEIEMAKDFLSGPEESGMSRLEQFAQVMLVCSEAIYVD